MVLSINSGLTIEALLIQNKFKQEDLFELDLLERKVSSIQASLFQLNPDSGRLNYSYLKKIHRFLFSDVYPWAGKTRDELGLNGTIRKENSRYFCMAENISDRQGRIFKEFKQTDELARCIKPEGFAESLAKFWNDLNYLHPFVDGNGRTTRVFIDEVCRRVGIRFDACLIPREKFIEASETYISSQDNRKLTRLIYDDLTCYSNEQTFRQRAEAIKRGQPLIIKPLEPNWQEEFF